MHRYLHLCLHACSADRVAHTGRFPFSPTHAEQTLVFSFAIGLHSDDIVTLAELRLAFHHTYVFFGSIALESFTLTHVVTLERVTLQVLGWYIVNEHGMCAVYRGRYTSELAESDGYELENAFHLVETCLKCRVCAIFKGELYFE